MVLQVYSGSFQLLLFRFLLVDIGKEVKVGKQDEEDCCVSNNNLTTYL